MRDKDLIKIADKSEFGWSAAREYDGDETGSNSEDIKTTQQSREQSREQSRNV